MKNTLFDKVILCAIITTSILLMAAWLIVEMLSLAISSYMYFLLSGIPFIFLFAWNALKISKMSIEKHKADVIEKRKERSLEEVVDKECSSWLLELTKKTEMWELEYDGYKFRSSVIHLILTEGETYELTNHFENRFNSEFDSRQKLAVIVTFAINSSNESLLSSPASYLSYYDMSLSKLYALHYEMCMKKGMPEIQFWKGVEDIVDEIWEETKTSYSKNYRKRNRKDIEDRNILRESLRRSAEEGYKDIERMKKARKRYFGK